MEKILVTGAAGFIGSHVVEQLLDKGYYVTALCKYNSTRNLGFLETDKYRSNSKLNIIFGDITDVEFIKNLVQKHKIIVNLAALIGIPYSYEAARSYFNVNQLGLLNILEGIKKTEIKLVQISTSEVYGSPKTTPIHVDSTPNAQSPYAASKVAADQLLLSYVKSFDVNASIVRPFNTYGPRQSRRAIIPTLISQMLIGKQIKLGNLEAKRDFTYVSDTASAIVKACTLTIQKGSVVQLGTGISYSIKDIVSICENIMNVKFEIIQENNRIRPVNSEINVLESDPSTSFQYLDWIPKIDFPTGLQYTIEWFKDYKNIFQDQDYVV